MSRFTVNRVLDSQGGTLYEPVDDEGYCPQYLTEEEALSLHYALGDTLNICPLRSCERGKCNCRQAFGGAR